MPLSEHDIAVQAFTTDDWKVATEALFQATGVSVNAMSFACGESLGEARRCTFCHLAANVSEPGPLTCFDSCPAADAAAGRLVCRSGVPSLYAPVLRAGQPIAHIVVSGFVTSTRERRGLYEQLLARGGTEDSARRAIKALPVVTRRQAESFLEIATATARTVTSATAERLVAAERVEELRLFVTAGQQVATAEKLDLDTLAGIAEEGVALVGGQAGAILTPKGASLEVIASTPSWRGPVGAVIPRTSTASGRAYDTRRAVVAPPTSPTGTATLAMPLIVGERVAGVLEVRVPAASVPVPPEQLSRLKRFGQFVAIALGREDERRQVTRALNGYGQLNQLAATLGGQTAVAGVAHTVVDTIAGSFAHGVAGLILTGWGHNRADITLAESVSSGEVDYILGLVSGREVSGTPFQVVRVINGQEKLSHGPTSEEWALSVVEMNHGDLTIGWLFSARRDTDRYTAQDNALLQALAAHAGAAFGRAALFASIRDDYAKTIAALSATLDHGERASAGHAGRVMDYAMRIGDELGLSIDDLEQLRFSGLLHDIGESGLPSEILLKPAALTGEEMAQIRSHVEVGASILDQIEFLKSLTPVVLHHHERWDGEGYPAGLAGEAIPLLARILSVADAFDVMLSERSYRPKMTIAQARVELEACSGTQFDPAVVKAMLRVLRNQALAGERGLISLPETKSARQNLPA